MADIILRDLQGSPVEYGGVTCVRLNTADGATADFLSTDLIPEELEEVPITLDFSGDTDQTVTASEGTVVKSAVIQKPENLIPANIAEGVDIAGIVGTLAGCGSHDDYNVFVKFWTAPTATSTMTTYTVATADELTQAGITLYSSSESTTNQLWTAVIVANMGTTSSNYKCVNFAYLQNSRLFYESSSSYRQGWWIARNSSGTLQYSNMTNTSPAFGLGSVSYNRPALISGSGLYFRYYTSNSYYPIGTYMCAVIQHKTKTSGEMMS